MQLVPGPSSSAALLAEVEGDYAMLMPLSFVGFAPHSWALSYLVKNKELPLKFPGQCCLSLSQIHKM